MKPWFHGGPLNWIWPCYTCSPYWAVLTPPVCSCSLISQHKDAGTQVTLCHHLQHTHVHPCNPEAEFWLQCFFWYVIIAETGFGIQGFYLALTLLILLYTQGKLTTLRNKIESWKFFNSVRDTDGEKANGNTAQRTIKHRELQCPLGQLHSVPPRLLTPCPERRNRSHAWVG